MVKRALLFGGESLSKDNPFEFEKKRREDLKLISEIAGSSGYKVDKTLDVNVMNNLGKYHDSDSFLFYFTGHASNLIFGRYSLNSFFDSLKKIKGKKMVILDACTKEYVNEKIFPKDTRVIGAHDVYPSMSLAKLLYGAVIFRGKKLEEVDKKTFEEMKHNWVYVGN